jgi:hypothetical protein
VQTAWGELCSRKVAKADAPAELMVPPGVLLTRGGERLGLPFRALEATMKRSLVCMLFLLILDDSGFSQTAKAEPKFYVVLNSLTKSCTVVDKVPRTDSPNITVATDTIYKTRAEAETAAKTLTPCSQ